MMRIAHVLVCHSYPPADLFDSIPVSDSPWSVFLHSDDAEVARAVRDRMRARKGLYIECGFNRGLAKSWNDGIWRSLSDGCDVVIVLNDDLYFNPGAYEKFVESAENVFRTKQDVSFVTTKGLEGGNSERAGQIVSQDFACAAFHSSVFEKVGCFDENYFPAYFEDNDFERRCVLSGLRKFVIDESLVVHARSATIRSMPEEEKSQFKKMFSDSLQYHRRKWSNPGEEYQTPFNQAYDLKIKFEDRSQPYGENDRSK